MTAELEMEASETVTLFLRDWHWPGMVAAEARAQLAHFDVQLDAVHSATARVVTLSLRGERAVVAAAAEEAVRWWTCCRNLVI